ncbi:LexA family transcriptional regulator [Labrys wisconsinensis]|uniref:Phage repressor protein C with HTH and peptisase S24 domain n=1 Tax=Labrys wisconsinensis TaxID=425677 RepID=A0ABU0JET1_9HYPH|nr:helix-turn-helix domain-containing protein [Labrys wisconsinensis]MDQ0472788.1 phage repressor protein C with HTH and peptisase S24 domain [Labrys wisconsinensis]
MHESGMVSDLGSIIRAARKAKKMTIAKVASELGVSIAAVGQWERNENKIRLANWQALVDLLNIDQAAAQAGRLEFQDEEREAPSEVEQVTDPSRIERGELTVDVLGVTQGGDSDDEDDFEINGDVIDRVRRPPGIANARNVFALHVIGESMIPRYEPGDLVYCGGRPPIPGDYVVIETVPRQDGSKGKSYIKKLVTRSRTELVCEQFNPPKRLTYASAEILRIHRIIPMRELMGI